MQIAKVVPKVRTSGDGVFDYSIPPEILPQIKCGILVEVPFHGRQIEAVVIEIKRSSKIEILKPITKIIDPTPVIDDLHLDLAKWMSDYYLAPLGQTLFENIVPSAKRTINKIGSQKIELCKNTKSISNRYLIIADFNRRLNFYLKAIEKTTKRKQSVLILIPDLSLINHFLPKIKNLIVLHSNLTKTERWLAWNKARQEPYTIVIGSQSALFAPVNNLGLVIVDQIENSTYKNDRSPRFSAALTTKTLAKLSKANLIFGSLTPGIENYFFGKKDFKILKHEFAKPKVEIIDTSNSSYILSETLKNNIEETISEKKKVLLIFNRKGEGSFYTCADCGWIYNCPKCDLPIKPYETKARCGRCESEYQIPLNCPKCLSANLKNVGIGTKKLAKIIRKLIPQANVINLEKNGDDSNDDFDIAIATSYALKFTLPDINLVAIIDADSYMNLPDFHSAEDTFSVYYKFLKISQKGLIQTSHPNDFFAKSLASLDYQYFFDNELSNRRKESFPPLFKLINLIYQDKDVEVCKKNAEALANKLKNINDDKMEILGPNPAFIYKKLNKFRWQIIIKTKNIFSEKTKELLKKQRNWMIDVDPVDLI